MPVKAFDQFFPDVFAAEGEIFLRDAVGGTVWSKVGSVVTPQFLPEDIESRMNSKRQKKVIRTDPKLTFEIQSFDMFTLPKIRKMLRNGCDIVVAFKQYSAVLIPLANTTERIKIWNPSSAADIPAGTPVWFFLGLRKVTGKTSPPIKFDGEETGIVVSIETAVRPEFADSLLQHCTPPDITQASNSDLDWKVVQSGASYVEVSFNEATGAWT